MFLRAILKDGTSVVSEYAKLARVQRYLTGVFQGQPFNAWKVVGTAHPISGEKVLIRERQMINGNEIVKVEQVEPTIEEHNLEPANFRPVAVVAKGERGLFTTPDTVPEELVAVGATAGTQFPKHRDPINFRDYIILRAANPDAQEHEEGAQELRYYLDGRGESGMGQPVHTSANAEEGDWGSDDDDDGFGGGDDDDGPF